MTPNVPNLIHEFEQRTRNNETDLMAWGNLSSLYFLDGKITEGFRAKAKCESIHPNFFNGISFGAFSSDDRVREVLAQCGQAMCRKATASPS